MLDTWIELFNVHPYKPRKIFLLRSYVIDYKIVWKPAKMMTGESPCYFRYEFLAQRGC